MSPFWRINGPEVKIVPKVYDTPDVDLANMKFYDAPKIDIADVEFVEIIKQTDRSFLCRARWQDKDCVLKVFIPYNPDTCESPFTITGDLFTNESRAYSRLKAGGFCERGSVPDFYGVVENIDPEAKGWQPQLKKFHNKTFPEGLDLKARPNGVLMEYIPDLNMIDISNYTEQRAHKLKQLLAEIHKAGILHFDLYPRNMLIQGDSDRVLWIDYELSEIYDPEDKRHPECFAYEREWQRP
ncbi:uncharacterized protein N7518_009202 [Penicillium psychrosexuale]|uniref:uncharacterized protein n=1 Tax=Penicillium psychrosexuale TaxID=1002107 RepID=UPI002544E3CD|nr:uncharacterized protein N7518_009202 [Penicillium psychrosexuale]KAJ5783525.1 hypothetical protein N7518_009202 [Penicillium psychrosexuale]